MWFDSLPPDTPWSSLWYPYIRCGTCNSIRTTEGLCPGCKSALDTEHIKIRDESGKEFKILPAYAGGETRYEDYVYLQLLEREWKRMERDAQSQKESHFLDGISNGASIVLIFWTYFESRIEYLLRRLLGHLPAPLLEDVLKRYSSISARLKDFYKIAFESTYHRDLCSLGYGDVGDKLATIRESRNKFVHGSPKSIDDSLVRIVVEFLQREHESWIAVYNYRVANPR